MKSYLGNYKRLTGHDWVENITTNDNDNSKLIQYALRLQQIEDEIERGRIIGLPCDIGDPVWSIMEFPQEGDCPIYQISKGTVEAFHLEGNDFYIVQQYGHTCSHLPLESAIFSEEEANKKLKELDDSKSLYEILKENLENAKRDNKTND